MNSMNNIKFDWSVKEILECWVHSNTDVRTFKSNVFETIIIINYRLIFKVTERSLITGMVWAEDHKLLQKSNVTVRYPHTAPIAPLRYLQNAFFYRSPSWRVKTMQGKSFI